MVVVTVLMLVWTGPAVADFPALGDVTGATGNGNTLTVSIGADRLVVQVCTPRVVRVDYLRGGQNDSPTPMIDPQRRWPGDPAVRIDAGGDPIVVMTARMRVEIRRKPCRLTMTDTTASYLLKEQNSGGAFVEDPASPTNIHGGLRFNHPTGHNFYGIRAYGIDDATRISGAFNLLRNGKDVNNSTYQATASTQGGAGAPFVWTTAGYGLLVDSDNGYVVVDDSKLEFYYGTPSTDTNPRRYARDHSLQYYLIVGSPKEILESAAQVTGQAPLFPRWATGFTNSQWGINQATLYKVIDLYRAKDIPIDNFTFDFDWKAWGEDDFGEFRWNPTNFPDAVLPGHSGSLLRDKMDDQGVKLTGIMKPRLIRCTTPDQHTPQTAQAKEADSRGFWYTGVEEHKEYLEPHRFVGELDFSKKDCRAWYWDQVRQHGVMHAGIVGFWNDEADEADVGSGQHFHFNNFQHFHMQQALYEGQRAAGGTPETAPRAWSLSRNFYLGAQRYAYGLWSGDISTGFNAMAQQSVRMLAAVNLGQTRWGMDTGGFQADPDSENYARWVQFSALVPVFRVHGSLGMRRQPWIFGPLAEEVAKDAIRLRYRLAPYVYAYEREGHERAVGLVRPLPVEFPADPRSANVSDEWMFGEWLLAAPVLRSQLPSSGEQATVRSIYLPPAEWVDYFRGDVWPGNQTITYPTNPGVWTDIPLFVRRGGVVLSHDVVRSLGEAKPDRIDADIFPDSTETGVTFYDDDGATYAYEGGAYLKQRITARDEGTSASLTVSAREGDYQSSVKHFVLRVHGRAGTAVSLDSTLLLELGDIDRLRTVDQGWIVGRDVYGPFTTIKVRAGQAAALQVRVTGARSVNATSERLDAEDGSLSGAIPSTRAHVSSNHTGFTGRGFVDGFDSSQTAVTFSTRVKLAGDYPSSVRAANATGGPRTLGVYVNGNRRSTLTVPSLVNWDTWTDIPVTLSLAAGNNIVTLRRDGGDTGQVAIDSLSVPFWPAAGLYEAESAELVGGSGVNRNHEHYSGVSFVDHLETPGTGVSFTVSAPQDGAFTVKTHYANATGSSRTLTLYVNGIKVKSATMNPMGDWDTWGDEVETVNIHSGRNTLMWKYDGTDTGHVNLDYILVTP
jgi:alpha-glucosidase (family GH31 glycosyl hydrolase)